MAQLFYLADLFGVAVFAITGALMAGRKSMDLFGVLVIAVITALGGGTLRDLILDNHPVSWIRDDTYIAVATLTAVGTVVWVRLTRPIHETGLLIADAFGLSVFTVIGTEVAMQHGVPLSTAVIMGVMTGVAGGVMRAPTLDEALPVLAESYAAWTERREALGFGVIRDAWTRRAHGLHDRAVARLAPVEQDMAADSLLGAMQRLLPSGRTVKLVTLKGGETP